MAAIILVFSSQCFSETPNESSTEPEIEENTEDYVDRINLFVPTKCKDGAGISANSSGCRNISTAK